MLIKIERETTVWVNGTPYRGRIEMIDQRPHHPAVGVKITLTEIGGEGTIELKLPHSQAILEKEVRQLALLVA